MKWLRTITGVAENIVSMFRQVDTLIQRIHNRQYIAKVKYENGVYKITVVDREGNAVDGAVVMVYVVESGTQTYSSTYGELSSFGQIEYNTINGVVVGGQWKMSTVRLSRDGIRLQILNNPRASLRVCVLGIEQGI